MRFDTSDYEKGVELLLEEEEEETVYESDEEVKASGLTKASGFGSPKPTPTI